MLIPLLRRRSLRRLSRYQRIAPQWGLALSLTSLPLLRAQAPGLAAHPQCRFIESGSMDVPG